MSENVAVSDAVAAAIAEAQAKAAALIAAQSNNLPAVQAGSTAVAAPQPGRRMTMDDPDNSRLAVDSWLGVKEHGFLVGPNKDLYTDEILVEIDLNAVARNESIKFGNPATYLKTYDGVTCASGGSWQAAIDRAQRVDPKAQPYPAADIPMRVLHDLKVKGKAAVVEEGQMIGYTTPTTGFANFKAFWSACTTAGLAGQTVKAKLGYEKRTNKNGNVWGVVTFTLAMNG